MTDLAERSYGFSGLHLMIDFEGIDPEMSFDNERINEVVGGVLRSRGLNVLTTDSHEFEPHGFTAVFLLQESHCSIHTYPEHGAAFVDIFTCGPDRDLVAIAEELLVRLGADRARHVVQSRGGTRLSCR